VRRLPSTNSSRASSRSPRCALQDDAGAEREQHRRAVGGRRCVAEIAGDRACVLDLHAADLARRRLERSEERRQVGADDVGPGRGRADRPAALVAVDAAQAGDRGDVEQRGGDCRPTCAG
jgi:hypothetical protein